MRTNSIDSLMILAAKTSIGYLIFIIIAFSLPIYRQTGGILGNAVDTIHANRLVIGEISVTIKIVKDPQSRVIGLSNAESLEPNSGMFFIFDEPDFHGIWMKDMNFSIDIIWLDQYLEIVDIKENISPETYPKVFTPTKKSLYVLEVNAGFVKKHGIKIGDLVSRL